MRFGKARLGALLFVAGMAATSNAAYAGTSTGTGTATFKVLNQCSVTGANVNLGTFTTTQTAGDVAASLGYLQGVDSDLLTRGTMPDGALVLGSVTCDAGTPYTLRIDPAVSGAPQVFSLLGLTLNGKGLALSTWARKIGDQSLGSNWASSIDAWYMSNFNPAAAIGTGAPQQITGNIYVETAYSEMQLTDQLGQAGVYSAPQIYTLTF